MMPMNEQIFETQLNLLPESGSICDDGDVLVGVGLDAARMEKLVTKLMHNTNLTKLNLDNNGIDGQVGPSCTIL